jgi:hypothetical protein
MESEINVSVKAYCDVREQAKKLGFGPISELAILPRNYEQETGDSKLAHESESSTIRKLFKTAGLDIQQIEKPEAKLPSIVEKSSDWIAPTIYFGATFLSQNSYAVQIALNVLASYIFEFLHGKLPSNRVKLRFVVESSKSRKCSLLEYEGPVSGINVLADAIRKIHDDAS